MTCALRLRQTRPRHTQRWAAAAIPTGSHNSTYSMPTVEQSIRLCRNRHDRTAIARFTNMRGTPRFHAGWEAHSSCQVLRRWIHGLREACPAGAVPVDELVRRVQAEEEVRRAHEERVEHRVRAAIAAERPRPRAPRWLFVVSGGLVALGIIVVAPASGDRAGDPWHHPTSCRPRRCRHPPRSSTALHRRHE